MVGMETDTEMEMNLSVHWVLDDDPIDNQTLKDQLFHPIDALTSILFRLYHHLG